MLWYRYFRALIIVFVCPATRKREKREREHVVNTVIEGKSMHKRQTSSEKQAKTQASVEL